MTGESISETEHHDNYVGPHDALVGAPWVPDVGWRRRPKVSLHDHLDGSVRAETIIDVIAAEGGDDALPPPPSSDPVIVERWLRGVEAGDLHHNLTFAMLCSVMQTRDSIERVAAEWVDTAAADGVVYGEARWAPEKHLDRGLTLDEAVAAVTAGLAEGARRSAASGHPIEVRQILCAIRDTDMAQQVAELAVRSHDPAVVGGVVGLDLAGVERDNPATPHLAAFQFAREHNVPVTIHAGEGDGLPSVWEALQQCHALRLGHGTRLVEDIFIGGRALTAANAAREWASHDAADVSFGPVAAYVRDLGIPLEQCVTSNARWIVPGIANHPIEMLRQLGFNVSVNPDNRVLSGISITEEFVRLHAAFGWADEIFATLTMAANAASFADRDTKTRLIDVIAEGWRPSHA